MATQQPPWQPPAQSSSPPPFDGQQSEQQRSGQHQPYEAQTWQSSHTQYPSVPSTYLGGQPGEPPKKAHRKRNITLAIVGGLFIISFIAHVNGQNKVPGKPTAANSPKAQVATPKHPAAISKHPAANPKTPAIAKVLAGLRIDKAVVTWFNDGAKADMQAVTADLDQVGTDAKAENFLAVARDCQQLSTAVTNLQTDGPMPYRPAEKWLARALALWNEGAAQCAAGASSENPAILVRSGGEVNKGTNDINRTTRLVSDLIGS